MDSAHNDLSVHTRFAPSPTGDLHLGGAWTALASWVWARRAVGTSSLRIEDIDRQRVVPRARESIESDLAWLGITWRGEVFVQSERRDVYTEAVGRLAASGLVYPCDCSRSEVSRVASAPHEGEEVVYPGTCRDRDPGRIMKRPPALRVRVPSETVSYEDLVVGLVTQDLGRDVGDFVLRRGDGIFSYQLAVVVDDVAMGITDVIRGADLLGSTPRQIWLARAMGARPPRFGHVPLVVASDGTRLQKRTPGSLVRDLRDAGVPASAVIGELAYGLGLAPTNAPSTAQELANASVARPVVWRRDPWPIPRSLLQPK